MKLDSSFADVLNQLEKERGIPVNELKSAIEVAFLSAYKKKFGVKENIHIGFNTTMTEILVTSWKKVVESGADSSRNEIDLEKAVEIDPEKQIGEEIELPVEVNTENFGRLAAQVAKQVITQKLREAEKRQVYDEYHDRKGQIVTGIVQRLEKNNVIVKLGKHEAVLMPSEQVPGEKFRVGDRLKLYLVELPSSTKGSQILLSRTNPGFVQKLFELEVPELIDGTVVIKSTAREAGYRTKIAVATVRGNADPVGACIGTRGARIKAIVNELMGEKIDIVRWSNNPVEFISNALSPAKVLTVKITDRDKSSAYVIVPDEQLSLAIGKEGQNVRLAARLTNFHIDIESESQAKAKNREKVI
jgi:N utilization substance protein A